MKEIISTHMSRRLVTREEIIALTADGWGFRKKERKGKLYISARKGKKEKGLGLYSDELWDIIVKVSSGLIGKPESPKDSVQTNIGFKEIDNPLIITFNEIKHGMSKHKMLYCLHVEANGFCDYWRLEELPKHAKQLNKKEFELVFKEVKNVDGKTRFWALNPFPIICGDCPGYIDEKILDYIYSRRR
jgi:hypothetical protein